VEVQVLSSAPSYRKKALQKYWRAFPSLLSPYRDLHKEHHPAQLHIKRARVEKGGHAIPEQKVRERYDRSRINLIRLMPRLTELRVFDKSVEAPDAGGRPEPKLLLQCPYGNPA
jgi:hypothetical protein